MSKAGLSLIVVLASASSLSAEEPAKQAQEKKKVTVESVLAKNALVVGERKEMQCRKIYPIGSLIPRRLCRTKEQWAVIDRGERAEARGIVGKGNGGFSCETIPCE